MVGPNMSSLCAHCCGRGGHDSSSLGLVQHFRLSAAAMVAPGACSTSDLLRLLVSPEHFIDCRCNHSAEITWANQQEKNRLPCEYEG